MKPQCLITFEQLISKPRLQSYKRYFHSQTDEAVGLYMWNGELASAFGSIVGLFEVVLRNRIHYALSTHLCSTDSGHWYDSPSIALKGATQQKVHEVRAQKPGASADEIVSRVSFGFWPMVLKTVYKPEDVFPIVFPHHVLTAVGPGGCGWIEKGNRKRALAYLYEVNDFRNRLAHNEPLWKFGAHTAEDGAKYPSTRDLKDSLIRLRRITTHLDEALESIDPLIATDVKRSSWRTKLEYLLSARGIARYRTQQHVPNGMSKTPAEFRRRFSLLTKANQPLYVRNMTRGGLFIPD